ncbi:MAG: response regulator transcription factor [Phycisphaerales bacterium]|nr:response regulator transcription factor [Phycisphaerales bacterium]
MGNQFPSSNTKAEITRIYVVDDHGLVRDGITSSLANESDFRVIGAAGSADEAIGPIIESRPDVVLMDIDMPGVSCFDAIQIIRSRVEQTRVILVTAHEHDEYLEQALKVKANGYVLKSEGMGRWFGRSAMLSTVGCISRRKS